MNEELRATLESYVDFEIGRARKLESGSEQESRAVESAAKIARIVQDDYRIENESDDRKSQMIAEKIRHDDEIKIKKAQIEADDKKSKRINPNTIFTTGGMFIAGMLVTVYEHRGNLTPKFAMNLVNKVIPK